MLGCRENLRLRGLAHDLDFEFEDHAVCGFDPLPHELDELDEVGRGRGRLVRRIDHEPVGVHGRYDGAATPKPLEPRLLDQSSRRGRPGGS